LEQSLRSLDKATPTADHEELAVLLRRFEGPLLALYGTPPAHVIRARGTLDDRLRRLADAQLQIHPSDVPSYWLLCSRPDGADRAGLLAHPTTGNPGREFLALVQEGDERGGQPIVTRVLVGTDVGSE